jgi:hypothetical protein
MTLPSVFVGKMIGPSYSPSGKHFWISDQSIVSGLMMIIVTFARR